MLTHALHCLSSAQLLCDGGTVTAAHSCCISEADSKVHCGVQKYLCLKCNYVWMYICIVLYMYRMVLSAGISRIQATLSLCDIYHRRKCRCLQLGFESHCLLWFNIASCAQHCVQLPLSANILRIYARAHSQHALNCCLIMYFCMPNTHCSHMLYSMCSLHAHGELLGWAYKPD